MSEVSPACMQQVKSPEASTVKYALTGPEQVMYLPLVIWQEKRWPKQFLAD